MCIKHVNQLALFLFNQSLIWSYQLLICNELPSLQVIN